MKRPILCVPAVITQSAVSVPKFQNKISDSIPTAGAAHIVNDLYLEYTMLLESKPIVKQIFQELSQRVPSERDPLGRVP